jgi:hypothetical protein
MRDRELGADRLVAEELEEADGPAVLQPPVHRVIAHVALKIVPVDRRVT